MTIDDELVALRAEVRHLKDRQDIRDGVWKIALRRCTIEWTMNGDTSMISQGGFAGFIKGTWDTDDPSYARPMYMATPAERW